MELINSIHWCQLNNMSTTHKEVESDDEEEVVRQEEVAAEPEVEEDTSLANSDVVTKYQEAARIVQQVMAEVSALVGSTPNSC